MMNLIWVEIDPFNSFVHHDQFNRLAPFLLINLEAIRGLGSLGIPHTNQDTFIGYGVLFLHHNITK